MSNSELPLAIRKPGIELVPGHGQRAARACGSELAHDGDGGVVHPAALVQRLDLLAQMTGEQDDVGEAVARGLLEEHVEKPHAGRNLEQRLGRGGRDRPQPGAPAADQE